MADRQPSPQEAGATEAFVHERASATPQGSRHRVRGALADRATVPEAPRDASLKGLEEWFVASIVSPCDGERLREATIRTMTAGPKLDALGRLGIYRHGYRARLVECLADDYPALQYALGEDAFESLCHEYIERHPSRAPSLNFFGRHMASFCREEAPGDAREFPLRAFAADLATLEWALVEVLHARTADALSVEELGAIPADRWPGARLPASNAVRILRFDYPVNAFFHAFKMGEEPSVPQTASASAAAVYRTDMTLWRMSLTPAMATLLEGLFRGETLGEALSKLEGAISPDEEAEAERSLMVWFREWVAGGFFARIELPED
jgi:hypothetical protein